MEASAPPPRLKMSRMGIHTPYIEHRDEYWNGMLDTMLDEIHEKHYMVIFSILSK